jgi:hypothetical protein
MADSPDIGGYTSHEDNSSTCVSSTIYRQDPASKAYQTPTPRPFGVIFSRASLLLFLCIFAFILPSAHSHVIPDTGSNSNVIHAARSAYQYQSTSQYDSSILGNGAALIKGAANVFQPKSLQYVPTQSSIVPALWKRQATPTTNDAPACTTAPHHDLPVGEKVGFAIVVVILVLLSGVFAGLTLGYMSLDETQLQVLMMTGSDVQKARAAKIIPIRKDGHLLLTTLLIANMITNEVSLDTATSTRMLMNLPVRHFLKSSTHCFPAKSSQSSSLPC